VACSTRIGVGAAVVLAGLGLGPAAAAADPADGLSIGVVQGLFRDVPQGMIKVLGKPLQGLIGKQVGLTPDLTMAPDALTLADRMKDKQCQLGVFHGFEFAWAKARNPDLVPLVVTIPPAGKLQAIVVVQKDAPDIKLADLKNKDVTIPRGTKGHCFAFLDRERGDFAATTARPLVKSGSTSEEALDAVVSGESPAALVDVSALAGYANLQPGACKQLRVLCESERFPQNVIAYSKGAITEEAAADLRRALTQAHTTPSGKPLMMLWNIKGFGAIPADYEEHLEKITKGYPAPAGPKAAAAPVRTGPGGD
jgi:ABC-type phosphate/phosphonate transport system substrate-binding protein